MKKSFCFLYVFFATLGVEAHDFASVFGGQTLYYSVTNAATMTVAITYPGPAVQASVTKNYTGVLEIPATVKHGGKTYRVTAIGPKAFSNASRLEGVVMPSGLISVGDFAFEGCTALRSIVFPANQVELGEGAFFRCSAISAVTLGNEWQGINLKQFRWSEHLTELYLPVRLQRLQNLKALRALRAVRVDANNPYYRSVEGSLYTTDGKTLLGVPRGYEGKVVIPDGVESVMRGALADCLSITEVDFPATLQTLWFGEFGQMKKLAIITFRGVTPVATATCGGTTVTTLHVANPKVVICVPKVASKAWKKALVKADGDYAFLTKAPETAALPVRLSAAELAGPANIKGQKSLNPVVKK